jgi:hypothetical protein
VVCVPDYQAGSTIFTINQTVQNSRKFNRQSTKAAKYAKRDRVGLFTLALFTSWRLGFATLASGSLLRAMISGYDARRDLTFPSVSCLSGFL